jgi:hypothetical protein
VALHHLESAHSRTVCRASCGRTETELVPDSSPSVSQVARKSRRSRKLHILNSSRTRTELVPVAALDTPIRNRDPRLLSNFRKLHIPNYNRTRTELVPGDAIDEVNSDDQINGPDDSDTDAGPEPPIRPGTSRKTPVSSSRTSTKPIPLPIHGSKGKKVSQTS